MNNKIPNNNNNNDNDKFLKITPNLFTPERLDLFDSLDLYITLIKNNKSIENGERLKNLSWRIINKSLININRSKKREGVKNIYYILNPQSQSQQQLLRPSKNIQTNQKQNSTTSLFPKSKFKSTTTLSPNVIQRYQSHTNIIKKKEDPENVVKGFDTNTIITRKISNSTILNRSSSHSKLNGNTFYIEKTPTPDNSGNNSDNNLSNKIISRTESLFANNNNNNSNLRNTQSSLFLSSEDEESDWNTLSDDDEDDDDDDDDELYDDEEEERYYRKQWDKLLFAKNLPPQQKSNGSSLSSSNNSFATQSSSHEVKKSLLSGLFLNTQGNTSTTTTNNNTPLSSSHILQPHPISSVSSTAISATPIPLPTLETQPINAIGSVPQNNNTLKTKSGFTRSSRESFSSIVPESIRQRFFTESNAPPSAQTILPTALSTHMFLPNNIHQQRIAAAEGLSMTKMKRRESIDIPSKNRNITHIKTRMEISEEEKLSKDFRKPS